MRTIDEVIIKMDAIVAHCMEQTKNFQLAHHLTNPGKWLSFLVKIIRWGEYKSVGEKMEILKRIQ